jgi:hypothetical protein
MYLAYGVGCRPSVRAERRFDHSLLTQSCLALAMFDDAIGDHQEAVAAEQRARAQ